MSMATTNESLKEPAVLSPAQEFWYFFKQNRGAVAGLMVISIFVFIAVFAPLLAPHNPTEVFSDALRLPPKWQPGGDPRFFLGTDDVGRVQLSRLIFGARISMGIGFLVVLLSATTGAALGLVAGYFGGWIDQIIMRLVDIRMSLPSILMAIVFVAILGPNFFNTILAVSTVAIPSFIRIVRGSVLAEKNKQYVIASQSFGASAFRQMFINILPNCMAPLIVQSTLGFSDGILCCSSGVFRIRSATSDSRMGNNAC